MNIKTPYQDLVHEVAEKETENESLRARVAELEEKLKSCNKENARIQNHLSEKLIEADLRDRDVEELRNALQAFEQFDGDGELWSYMKSQRDTAFQKNDQLRREIEAMREDAEVGRLVREIAHKKVIIVERIGDSWWISDGAGEYDPRLISEAPTILEALRKAANDE